MVKFQDLEEQAVDEAFGAQHMSDGATKQYRTDFDCEQRDHISPSHTAALCADRVSSRFVSAEMMSAKNTLGMILVAPGAVAADGKSPLAKLAQVSRQEPA